MILGWIAKKVIKLALSKSDIQEQIVKAADVADKYADKYLGKKTSQEVQNQICDYVDENVKIFTDRLKQN